MPNTYPFSAPVDGTFVGGSKSHFGADRGSGREHAGSDWQASDGSTARAVIAGTVVYAGKHSGYGAVVDVLGDDGYVQRYATHESTSVKPGQHVKSGQALGIIGQGHLHFEVIRPGTPAFDAALSGKFGQTSWYNGQPQTVNPATYFGIKHGTHVTGGLALGAGGGFSAGAGNIQSGARGQQVASIQSALQSAGYSVGKYGADGVFGGDTTKAVVAFQRANGLDPDGIVGPRTATALQARTGVMSQEYSAPRPGVSAARPASPAAPISISDLARGQAATSLPAARGIMSTAAPFASRSPANLNFTSLSDMTRAAGTAAAGRALTHPSVPGVAPRSVATSQVLQPRSVSTVAVPGTAMSPYSTFTAPTALQSPTIAMGQRGIGAPTAVARTATAVSPTAAPRSAPAQTQTVTDNFGNLRGDSAYGTGRAGPNAIRGGSGQAQPGGSINKLGLKMSGGLPAILTARDAFQSALPGWRSTAKNIGSLISGLGQAATAVTAVNQPQTKGIMGQSGLSVARGGFNPQVAALQTAINSGGARVAVDGLMGPQTRAASAATGLSLSSNGSIVQTRPSIVSGSHNANVVNSGSSSSRSEPSGRTTPSGTSYPSRDVAGRSYGSSGYGTGVRGY